MKYRTCHYRGIYNPCDEWMADSKIKDLRLKALEIKEKPMSSWEHEFVNSCTTKITFSPKQENTLISIYNRVK